jgi:hypothetical protein
MRSVPRAVERVIFAAIAGILAARPRFCRGTVTHIDCFPQYRRGSALRK